MNYIHILFCALIALSPLGAHAATVNASFTSVNSVPITDAGYTAAGNDLAISLGFAPQAGTSLTVVKNTGLPFISGQFSNLVQGQVVNLTYDGITYKFVANYYGGSGNDLVLHWAYQDLAAWGGNSSGQLGDGSATARTTPVSVIQSGVLANKTLVSVAAGSEHSLALCSDGTLAAWGWNSSGQLGDGSTTNRSAPVLVTQSGVLAGKVVVAISAGGTHSLALCSDGTLAAWGYNSLGQLGDGGTTNRTTPVLVTQNGVLAGKVVVAISAGSSHSLALCSDGTLAAWGSSIYGKLGDGSTTNRSTPVLVTQSGVLAGKTVVAVAAGNRHSFALCSDGTLATWGFNNSGQLGDGTTTNRSTPVLVQQNGVLAGKTVVAMAGGDEHSLALCSDGTLAAWGSNTFGQIGNSSSSSTPVIVTRSGALSDRSVVSIDAGTYYSLASCSDGMLAAWGRNSYGELGNIQKAGGGTPLQVDHSGILAGKKVTAVAASSNSCLALASSPLTEVSELSQLGLSDGSLFPAFSPERNTYAASVPGNLSSLTLTATLKHPDSATLKINGTSALSGSPSDPIPLSAGINMIEILVAAETGITCQYTLSILKPEAIDFVFQHPNDVPVVHPAYDATGLTSHFSLGFAPATGTTLTVVKNTGQGLIRGQFSNLAQGQAVNLSYGGESYRFVANYYGGTGNDLVLHWAYQDLAAWGNNSHGQLGNGSKLQRVDPIGVFQNGVLANKTLVSVATGSSHSLALCSDGTLAAWGRNDYGQLGDGSRTDSNVPVLVAQSGVLDEKTVVAVSAAGAFSMALCSDGTLVTWGDGASGALGNGMTFSDIPVGVDQGGVLAGKTVVAISAGCLVLCSDGTVAAWGSNDSGQLGNYSSIYSSSSVPVLVSQSGVLAGKEVVEISGGSGHSLALCSDGTLAAWGSNAYGELGDGTTNRSTGPVLVTQSGVLAGKTVVAVAAGHYHSLALCSDGTLASWGRNASGELGDGTTTNRSTPILVTQGLLAGKAVTEVTAGSYSSLALCSDGTLVEWGGGFSVPTAVDRTGFLSGKVVTSFSLGGHRLAIAATPSTSDLASIGLSSGSLSPSFSPETTSYTASVSNATNWITISPSSAANMANIAVNGTAVSSGGVSQAIPLEAGLNAISVVVTAPDGVGTKAYTVTVTRLPSSIATLSGLVPSSGTLNPTFASGTTSYTASVANSTTSITVRPTVTDATASIKVNGNTVTSGSASTPIPLNVGTNALTILVTAQDGTTTGIYSVVVTRKSAVSTLSGLALSTGSLSPAFDSATRSYTTSIPQATGSITLTPVVTDSAATVKVNGTTVATGSASSAIPLLGMAVTTVTILVAAEDPAYTTTYILTVAERVLSSPNGVSVTLTGFTAAGNAARFALGFAPSTGSSLTLVNNTGIGLISGEFQNLRHGQELVLSYGGRDYRFVVDYFGGTGNDLVLQWADNGLIGWGENAEGQLGIGSLADRSVPTDLVASGLLSGKKVAAVSAGQFHTLVLSSDGTVTSWGLNSSGQLGNNSTTNSSLPEAVSRPGFLDGKQVVAMAAGGNFSLALCADGTLASWGDNSSGQLGDGSTKVNSIVPLNITGKGALSGRTVVSISAGERHALALCSDGILVSWGANESGQLGNGTTQGSNLPVLVSAGGALAGKSVRSISAGGKHSLALSTDGSMAAWGANQAGQLGNNSTTASSVPVTVPRQGAIAGKTVIGLSAGGDHSLAVCSDGTVAAWGLNSSGQLGNASNNTSYVPVAVTMTTGALLNKRVVSVSASAAHSLALCLDETVVAWGANPNGSLGNNSTTSSTIPVAVTGAGVLSSKKVAAVNAGGAQSFALCTDGSLAGWGLNTYGQLGDNSTESAKVPVAVTTTSGALFGKTVVSTAVGQAHTVVRFSDGGMAAWGLNSAGQLGNNTTTNSNIPVAVFSGGVLQNKTVAAVSAGASHNVALCSDGTVVTWGSNAWGKLGNGSSIVSSLIPVDVTSSGALAGKQVVGVAAGANHCLALCSDGRVVAWGRGDYGQLGVGGFSTSSLPVEVKWDGVLAGKSVIGISAGADHNLAVCSDGTLVAWGRNDFGQLGNNITGNRAEPTLVSTNSGALMGKTVAALAAGTSHSLVLCTDGTLSAWGSNAEGQLGSIGTNGSYVPIAVTTNIGALYGKTVRRIACGEYHNLALCTDGALASWGLNTSGQLGNNSAVNSDIPESVTSAGALSGKTAWAIASGGSSSYVQAALPNPPTLSALKIGTLALSPVFSSATTTYTASVSNSTASITITPTATDPASTIKVNGSAVLSGSASSPIPLSVGTNTITIAATAQDGMNTKTYTVTVSRAASSVATLSGLALTTGTLSPAFSSATTTYTSLVSIATSSLKVSPTTTVSTATVKINGASVLSGSASSSIPLSLGTNTIAIQVTAQDGITVKTYTVKVTRLASSVNTLSGLVIKSASLSPKFNKTKSVYTASVASSVSSLKVRPTATSNLATIKVNGSKVKSGSLSKAIALKRGKNTIKVVVTAQDGTTKTYKITVTRGGVAKAIAISAARNSPIQKRAIPEIAEITKTTVEGQTYLQLTLMKGNENMTRVVEVSSNLVDWYSGNHHTTTLIDDDSMLRVRDNTPIKPSSKRHIRLRHMKR